MALEIKWTPQADKGLERVIQYLEAEMDNKRDFATGKEHKTSNQTN